MMNVLDLFSGIGGFSLGLERTGYFETVAFCEREPYPKQVLKKHWPDVPIIEDVHELETIETISKQVGGIDVVTGGFPCQPFSGAGNQKGKSDDRYLWPAMLRIVAQEKPSFVIGENVSGIVGMALDTVLSDLEAEGYTTQSFIIPACGIDAPHRRDRVWILAYSGDIGRWDGKQGSTRRNVERELEKDIRTSETASTSGSGTTSGTVPNSDGTQRPKTGAEQSHGGCTNGSCRRFEENRSELRWEEQWKTESGVCRIPDGLSERVDRNRKHRIKALGNSVVPQIVTQIGLNIVEFLNAQANA